MCKNQQNFQKVDIVFQAFWGKKSILEPKPNFYDFCFKTKRKKNFYGLSEYKDCCTKKCQKS